MGSDRIAELQFDRIYTAIHLVERVKK